MGVLGTLGTTYIFDGWRTKMPKTGDKWSNKFIALTAFVFLAICAEVAILVPFTMSRVLGVSIAEVLQGGVWWWSLAVVVMPFLLLGGVSLGNQIVTVDANTNVNTQATPQASPQVAKKSRKRVASDELLAYLQANPGASNQQVGNHFGVSRQAIDARVKNLYALKDDEQGRL